MNQNNHEIPTDTPEVGNPDTADTADITSGDVSYDHVPSDHATAEDEFYESLQEEEPREEEFLEGELSEEASELMLEEELNGYLNNREAITDLLKQLQTIEKERDSYLGDLQRVTAEFANFRRQTVKRNAETVAQAASQLAESLLPVLDACEAAVMHGVEGIEVIGAQILGVLENAGLSVISTTNEPFDPNQHEAVGVDPPDTEAAPDAVPVVSTVLRTGYAWKTKVIRPAMVRVKG